MSKIPSQYRPRRLRWYCHHSNLSKALSVLRNVVYLHSSYISRTQNPVFLEQVHSQAVEDRARICKTLAPRWMIEGIFEVKRSQRVQINRICTPYITISR